MLEVVQVISFFLVGEFLIDCFLEETLASS